MLSFEDIKSRLSARFTNHTLHSLKDLPHPSTLANVTEASKLIVQAIKENQKILIVGDYDADGILSTALMVFFFRSIGAQNFSHIIPNRFSDGYGISPSIIENNPADLIITVDNGITALEVATLCKQNAQTLIITDHHTPKEELPDALIINPKVSGFIQEEICGCFVAWYLCAGIKQALNSSYPLASLLEFVAIATISDIMPLTHLNRIILIKALKLFENPSFAFTQFLLKQYKKIDEECLGYYIAPLINASGRMGEAQIALDFILSSDLSEAKTHYESLQKLNEERKNIQASLQLQAMQAPLIGEDCVIAYGEDWHEGVLGILAGKLAEHYGKSAFALTLKNGIYQGSGRGIRGVNLLKSLEVMSWNGLEFGGHSKAVGIKIANITDFHLYFKSYPQEENQNEALLGEIGIELLTPSLLGLLRLFAPYGEGNPQPLFFIKTLQVLEHKIIGKEKNHTSLLIHTPYKPLKAIFYHHALPASPFLHNVTFAFKEDTYTRKPLILIKSLS